MFKDRTKHFISVKFKFPFVVLGSLANQSLLTNQLDPQST